MNRHLHAVATSGPNEAPTVSGSISLIGGVVTFVDGQGFPFPAPPGEDLGDHARRLGIRPVTLGPAGDELRHALQLIHATGRGGGHFPVAQKWATYLAAGGAGVLVGNGAESEPLSAKDAALLQLRPHLVLDGLSCTAEAVGAVEVVLWLHESAHGARHAISRAIAERVAAGHREPRVRIELAPTHYLSGESSSIVQALSGGPALPQFRREPAARSGVHGRPTLVHNVETLARIALTARNLVADTTMFTVAVDGVRTVVEVPATEPLPVVLRRAGVHFAPTAVLVGGFGGRFVDASALSGLVANEASLRAGHASLGAGVLVPIRAGECGIGRAAEIARYLADSSARQCGPCLFGLPAVADLLGDLVDGRAGRRDLPRLHRFLAEIAGRGACRHPDGAIGMVASALDVFSYDVWSHLRRSRCADA
jgi:NADH:ubiquinone oxidoreductase subunit F (NADH-binding)